MLSHAASPAKASEVKADGKEVRWKWSPPTTVVYTKPLLRRR